MEDSTREARIGEAEVEGKRRMVDYLNEDDDGEEIDAVRKGTKAPLMSCSCSSYSLSSRSPRTLLSKWLLRTSKRGGGVAVGWGVGVGSIGEVLQVLWWQEEGGGGSGKLTVSSGLRSEDASFNLGIGLGLALLLAKTASEFNKMSEVRTQMEMLLKQIKDEFGKKDVISSLSGSSNSPSSATLDFSWNAIREDTIALQYNGYLSHQGGLRFRKESDSREVVDCESSLKMNKLEAELEVELERLQLNMEGENTLLFPEQHRTELSSDCTSSSKSFTGYVEEFDEGEEEDNSQYFGVSAIELERKLHELLHTRQQERIAELESTLKCVERKLVEKEIEARRWKDAARVASQNRDKTLVKSCEI
uniref:Protein POLAR LOCALIZATION DURING ASYMMETRIC DIVISION AND REDISTRIBUTION n=1 Tax=Ananas comosus var. bracteatus TaxID=296719 RepID=A0A6V7QAL8_ANACO|nr:unnamed protein product [Ananas comosus var. bracteatus]